MCGIIAVLNQPIDSAGSSIAKEVAKRGKKIQATLGQLHKNLAGGDLIKAPVGSLIKSAQELNQLLKGWQGVAAILDLLEEVAPKITEIADLKNLVTNTEDSDSQDQRQLEDLLFSLRWDRLETALKVKELLAQVDTPSAICAMTAVQVAFAGIDKLEVRGRDSAGIQILIYGEGEPQTFTYKIAQEVGALGYNITQLRRQILNDKELLEALQKNPSASSSVLAHTRWASVGLISNANAHPLTIADNTATGSTQTSAVVNGYIDNYQELLAETTAGYEADVTTDSRVVPALFAKELADAASSQQAFQNTIAQMEGSVAIAAITTENPHLLHLSLSGSGQALYVGLAENSYIVASEPYGVVAEADQYLRMEDECIYLSAQNAGSLKGIKRFSRDGKQLSISESDLTRAEISSKDIARGNHPHFFIKEIFEAPQSIQKTLSGKLKGFGEELKVELGQQTLTTAVSERLKADNFRRIYVIGQGTAAVAAQAVADAIKNQIPNISIPNISIEAILASELSSVALNENAELFDSLVIAVSQSGTTTDTNRTVDLVRSRGAVVLSIVNRRSSDLVDRSDGVFYTSDGRDVEMSVASTKAFYSQAVAGILLGCGIADLLGVTPSDRQALLASLKDLPAAMVEVLAKRAEISEMAVRLAPSSRWWAVVGNGRDSIAAEEVRIKLSELCYKSISKDSIEDKKHIDLSCEPLILVCAAGLTGSVAQDMAAEVNIYCAHRALPIIFTNAETAELLQGRDTFVLPTIDNRVAFILSALAGHLFSYEAALAIDAGAIPLRKTRALIEQELTDCRKTEQGCEDLLADLHQSLIGFANVYEDNLRRGEYNGHLQASTASHLSTLYRYATSILGLESYQLDFGTTGTPTQVVEDLVIELSYAIDELSRPIDAIRHQAKTVTVGISRSDDTFLDVPLVQAVFAAGAPKDQLSYESLKMLAGLNPVVEEVKGYIRYFIEGTNLSIVDRSGEAAQLESRVEKIPELWGIKHRVTTEQKVLITKGRMDGRTILIVPEVKNAIPVGLTLLHIKPVEFLPPTEAAEVMRIYKGRLEILEDAVRETEPSFDESLLGTIPIMDLLDQPIAYLADKWSGK